MECIQEQFHVFHIEILSMKAQRLDNGNMEVEFYAKLPNSDSLNEMLRYFKNTPDIRSFKI